MRLLMFTYCIDDDCTPLSFVTQWITELSKRVSYIHLIVQWEGKHQRLPKNVIIHTLHKDKNHNKLKRLISLYKICFDILNSGIDVCFIHMHAIMVPIVWPILFFYNIKIVTWYAHNHVCWHIPIVHLLSSSIVTSTANAYSYSRDAKVKYIGQGMSEKYFYPIKQIKQYDILSVGRISPIKNLETIIHALKILQKKGKSLNLHIVGEAPMEHILYKAKLEQLVIDLDLQSHVVFHPSVRNSETPSFYRKSWIHINCGPRKHSIDKAILEAAFSGIPSLTSVEALKETYSHLSDRLIFKEKSAEDLAVLIDGIPKSNSEDYFIFTNCLYNLVKKHSLSSFMDRLTNVLKENVR